MYSKETLSIARLYRFKAEKSINGGVFLVRRTSCFEVKVMGSSRRYVTRLEGTGIGIGGWFDLVDTYGVPLSMIADKVASRGGQLDWLGFYTDARSHNWGHGHILSEIREATGFCYGSGERDKLDGFLRRFEGAPLLLVPSEDRVAYEDRVEVVNHWCAFSCGSGEWRGEFVYQPLLLR